MRIETYQEKLPLEDRLKLVKFIVTDIDGVLTDGRIRLVGREEMKVFNAKDAVAIGMCIRSGIPVALFTGRKSEAATKRAEELGTPILFKKAFEKYDIPFADYLLNRYGVTPEEVLYVGDDLGDLFMMKQFGISATPKDGSDANREMADIILERNGGEGVLVEIVQRIMKSQNTWDAAVKEFINRFHA
jgi:3-deoxy-D-manno-octulosonate 8-phosphate phosphatase (KDO 8-P phosphatase)